MASISSLQCRHFIHLLKPLSGRNLLQTRKVLLRFASRTTKFNEAKVQVLLKRITGRNLDKVLASRRESGMGPPSYKLMTDEDLAKAEEEIEKEAERYLEMPPVMEERCDSNLVLDKRPELDGYSECNIVFTDISTGTNNRDRCIVVHEPDGMLREAHWEERDRMNFLFFQRDGQSYQLPSVLKDENLQNAFNRHSHADVLDLVCVQCEPDSADYIRVHKQTYEDLYRRRLFDLLRSTRHFGGMVFYIVKEKQLTWLLVDMLRRNLIADACDVVRLFHILHPGSKSAEISKKDGLEGLDLLKAYVRAEGPYGLHEFLDVDEMNVESVL